ncbi:S-adenosyl-L-methionine-dependent methyltransferase [Patellaria atrata CBS 101060]|uniref:S-adenosyl-L-methionine-dependent methyltransferase n=1 Tax=Patellaria atrata CBS 101060 TaxID=1346257 RepID=A0A9P4S4S9_9PEZI|nr:S-adenosyl-L-methionine-dependent methyltransferase [Patellaria atrata CBS 101060]
MSDQATEKDRWSSKTYTSSASFVPKLTNKVLSFLPAPGTSSFNILDIGCGDGVLTSKLLTLYPDANIIGLDSSPSMIETATQNYPKISFQIQDCTDLLAAIKNAAPDLATESYDIIFSNAAMHWILREKSCRSEFFAAMNALLKTNGLFVFEMGGWGNIAELHTALVAALVAHGIPVSEGREASPWFFPSDRWMEEMLQSVGFAVEELELELRPTRLDERRGEDGGVGGWVRLMGQHFLEKVEEKKRESVVQYVEELLNDVVKREEDEEGEWVGYVRLRGKGRKL